MTSASGVLTSKQSQTATIQAHLDEAIEGLLASLPAPQQVSADQRRGIIARYSAVLEGNFIYWMTGAYLAVGTAWAASANLRIMPGWQSRTSSRRFSMIFARASSDPTAR